jgi:serine phosphatase RsbU (regulator of sigma subunit)
MESSARRFARWIILIHAVLLAAVIGVVVLALRQVHSRALEQALSDASGRQELLVRQTAAGIADYYASIIDNLDLAGAEGDEIPPALRPAVPMARGLPLLLWDQLQRRVMHFVTVERDPGGPARVVRSFPLAVEREAKAIIEAADAWLAKAARFDVSGFEALAGREVSLVCVKVAQTRRMLVAVVGLDNIRQQFLSEVGGPQLAARLLDDQGATMAVAGGGQLQQPARDPRLIEAIQAAQARGSVYTRVFRRRTAPDGSPLPSILTTVEQVNLLRGVAGAPERRWWVAISSDLDEVDNVVDNVFRGAVSWAVFVVAAVTALLLSSSVLLIRARLRMQRERNAMIARELDQARRIQAAWLPAPLKGSQPLSIAATNHPATTISGDFYDWFELGANGEGRSPRPLVVTIGDVTGHGMGAAFLMATTQLLVRTTMLRVRDPGKCLEEVNRHLCTQAFSGQFVTLLVLVIDGPSCAVEMASAGHYAPLLRQGDGWLPMNVESQLVLGVDAHARYATDRVTLSPGASMLLYTDGAIDARSDSGERFTQARLLRSLDGAAASAEELLHRVLVSIDLHRGSSHLADDLTLVAVHLAGPPAPGESLAPS